MRVEPSSQFTRPLTEPLGYEQPDWEGAGRVHEWRNYVSDEVQAMWPTFTPEQRLALARQAEMMAEAEDWD